MANPIEERKQRWLDFMDPAQPDRHLFQISLTNAPTRPWPGPDNLTERIAFALDRYERETANLAWLADDRIPALHVYTGTEIFAEAFGCPVHRPANNMPFALPVIHAAHEVSRLPVPGLATEPLASLFRIADELKRQAGQDALLQLPDIQSPLDIAALIWEKTDFYVALLEEPAAVQELLIKIKALLLLFFDTWFARYGTDYLAHYPDYFMRGGLTLSEDEVGAISGDLFRQFALPDLSEISRHYGGLGMHCCANARHQWDNFLAIPGLRLLNLVQPEAQIREAYGFFAGKVGQMHSWCGNQEPWTWPDQLPAGVRAVLTIQAANRDEARRIAERMNRVCSR